MKGPGETESGDIGMSRIRRLVSSPHDTGDEKMQVKDNGCGWSVGSRFFRVKAPCPYGVAADAAFIQARMPSSLSSGGFAALLAAGFRRNGDFFYRPDCPACSACIPIRLDASSPLEMSRSQRRNLKRNRDLDVELAPLTVSRENLDLLGRFFAARFPGRDNDPLSYYSGFFLNSFGMSAELRYLDRDRLLGVAVVDMSAAFINCVYFYFDPDESGRGPGIFNILNLHRLALNRGIPHVYLGLLIRELGAMSYKAAFRPHYLLEGGGWRRAG